VSLALTMLGSSLFKKWGKRMFQVDEYAVKQRMNELQEEFKQYRLASQCKSTKKKP
jgi:hypothetical protein